MGLIGKIRLTSLMNEDDVRQEISSVFRSPMGNDPYFPFTFLQETVEGSKTLRILLLSPSYELTAEQVAQLGGQKKTIYILAQGDMPSPPMDQDKPVSVLVARDYLI